MEKILDPDEELRPWPVAGTTGYDFCQRVGALFVDPSAERAFSDLYVELTGEGADYHTVVERAQRDAVRAVRDERDNDKVARELERLEETARGPDNLLPVILDCARCYATEGEIIDTLKKVFGEYQEPPFF